MFRLLLALVVFFCQSILAKTQIMNDFAGTQYLPDQFQLYYKNNQASNELIKNALPITLPVNNNLMISRGCYIACYSHEGGVYTIADHINVHGLVKIVGYYKMVGDKLICQPKTNRKLDLSQSQQYAAKCNASFPSCHNSCWSGGDTGGWFWHKEANKQNDPRYKPTMLINAAG